MPWLSLVIRSWVLRARELTGSAVQLLAELIQLILMRGGKARGRWTAHGGRSSEERVPPGHAEKPARHRGWTAVVNAAECPNTPWGGNSATLASAGGTGGAWKGRWITAGQKTNRTMMTVTCAFRIFQPLDLKTGTSSWTYVRLKNQIWVFSHWALQDIL